ncbi:MAG: hypothetical protein IJO06_14200 [Thermoguttaceae bacterium]|nr:hypothetical protein [Thermoguttaceae bacterium]
MAGLTLFTMFSFIALGSMVQCVGTGGQRNGAQMGEIAKTSKYGTLDDISFQEMSDASTRLARFARTAFYSLDAEAWAQTAQMAQYIPENYLAQFYMSSLAEKDANKAAQAQRLNALATQLEIALQNSQEMVNRWLIIQFAKDKGLAADDEAATQYLQTLIGGSLAPQDWQNCYAAGGLNDRLLLDLLKEQIAYERAVARYVNPGSLGVSVDLAGAFEAANRSMKASVVAFNAEDYVGEIADPSEEELKKFYEQYRNVTANAASATPGFTQPTKIALEVVRADVTDEVLASITDEEIQKYYDEHRDEFKKPAPAAPTAPAEPQLSMDGIADIELTEEAAPAVEEAPATEEAVPAVEEAPATEEAAPAVEEAPATEEAAPAVEEAPAEEAAPAVEEAPATEEAAPAVEEAPAEEAPAEEAPAEAAPAEETPAEEAPAEEAPAEEAPAEEAPAEEAPAEEAPAEEAPAEEAPAEEPTAFRQAEIQLVSYQQEVEETAPAETTEDAAAEAPAAEETAPATEAEYYPLDEVKERIRQTLAREKTSAKLDELNAKFAAYYEQYKTRKAEGAEVADLEAVDAKAFAEENGFAYYAPAEGVVETADEAYINEALPLTELQAVYQRPPLAYKANKIDFVGDSAYVYRATEIQQENTPEFEAARDYVLAAWKLREAAKLAQAAADEFAAKAKAEGADFAALAGDKLVETERFGFVESTSSLQSFASQSPVQLAEVREAGVELGEAFRDNKAIVAPGWDFNETAFGMNVGDVAVVANQPKNRVFVLKLTEKDSEDALRENLEKLEDDYELQGVANLLNRVRASRFTEKFIENLREEAGFEWVSIPRDDR